MWRIQAFDRDGREISTLDVAGGEITIGREADRRLVLPSPSVSRRHAKIVLDGPQPYVQDEGSANGVLVNGVRIGQPTALVPGTRIDIAEFRIEFGAAQQVYAQPAPSYGAPQPAWGGTPALRLMAEDGPFAGRAFDLKPGEIALGRAIDNDLVFDDPSLSRKHARLRYNGDHIEVEDLRSSNGSFVNGRRVDAPMIARAGDVVRFGELHFRLEGDQPAAAAAPQQAPSYAAPQAQPQGAWEEERPARAGMPPAVIYGGAAALVVIIGGLVAALLLRGGKSPGGNPIEDMQAQVAQHLKAGKEKLEAKDFVGAEKEFKQVIEADPANAEARRQLAVAQSEPQNEQLSKQVRAKVAISMSRAELETAMKLYGQIPAESMFHAPTAQKVAGKLVAFGTAQCKAKKFVDCAWAICRAHDVVPAADRASIVTAEADATMKDAEKKLVKDKTFTPCKRK